MNALKLLLLTVALAGCSFKPDHWPGSRPAQIAEKSTHFLDLQLLPKPKGPIAVSVYGFRDQTGQYKPSSNVSSFSTAISQGGTAILTQALTDTAWFLPVEREGLQDILTERKIIRAAQQKADQEKELPPLMTSSIILEGGITGYDSNITTGGMGLGYYGFSTSQLYRQDQITVYLRAVDVMSGRVLLSISTSKSVMSQEVRSGLFRYVAFNRLAEFEAGYTTNEPLQLCLLQAIQRSVADLVMEGIVKGIWQVQSPKELDSPLLQRYQLEKKGLLDRLKSDFVEQH